MGGDTNITSRVSPIKHLSKSTNGDFEKHAQVYLQYRTLNLIAIGLYDTTIAEDDPQLVVVSYDIVVCQLN